MHDNVIARIKTFFLPFIVALLLFTAIYSLLNWWLFTHLAIFPVEESVLDTMLPLVLAFVPAWYWIWPRIALLELRHDRSDMLYYLVVYIGLALPVILTQHYIRNEKQTLLQLQTMAEISQRPAEAYQVKQWYVAKQDASVWTNVSIEGKHGSLFVFSMYVTVPVFTAPGDTITGKCLAWYGIKYHTSMSNRLSDEEKGARCDDFLQRSWQRFQEKNVYSCTYLERPGYTSERANFRNAANLNKRYSYAEDILLLPMRQPFAARTGGLLWWLLSALLIFSGIWLMVCLKTPLKQPESKPVISLAQRWHPATAILCWFIGSSLFIAGQHSPGPNELIFWGASSRPLLAHGQWWRLLTNLFLNITALQGFYIVTLYLAGYILEPVIRGKRFLFAWLLSGMAGSLLSVMVYPDRLSFGASGAILGIWGVILMFIFRKKFSQDIGVILLYAMAVAGLVVLFLILGFKGSSDSVADMGGLLAGLMIGWIYARKLPDKQQEVLPEHKNA
ncbi:rhomboid family intramembrane serine protease [Chitinophaga sp. G-6-1-13]|uniref:Rhomboid family intramembrane serine protease n=1 Tax=Chitinophaga fulva TaxID=2728842 RepID=A0A848GIJ1_9BACT|nr:rhomboid family intramembrane serine protease [Chitinophaga fulva]NML37229.1 rhomboid family intramembrane serine protease [Chitinophaga fulva]